MKNFATIVNVIVVDAEAVIVIAIIVVILLVENVIIVVLSAVINVALLFVNVAVVRYVIFFENFYFIKIYKINRTNYLFFYFINKLLF